MLRTFLASLFRGNPHPGGEPQIMLSLEDVVEIQRRIERAYKRAIALGLPLDHPVVMDLKIAHLILKKTAGRCDVDLR